MGMFVVGNDKTKGTPAVVTQVEVQQPYALLSRVKDDSNNDIGCVIGYHIDANNQKYAVVCLNAVDRQKNIKMLSDSLTITGIGFVNYFNALPLSGSFRQQTAMQCNDVVINAAQAAGYTAPAYEFCRSIQHTIGGVTYFGQVPTIFDYMDILTYMTEINNADPTALLYANKKIQTGYNYYSCSLPQNSSNSFIRINYNGGVDNGAPTSDYMMFTVPILEIPIQ